jgi:hypothetical protein
MRSPRCLSVYPSVSVHLSVYPPLIFEMYDITLLAVCVFSPDCC